MVAHRSGDVSAGVLKSTPLTFQIISERKRFLHLEDKNVLIKRETYGLGKDKIYCTGKTKENPCGMKKLR